MPKFPVDAPRERVLGALQRLGFELIRDGNHIALARDNPNGTCTPLTMPNYRLIKRSTLRLILRQSEITREDFIEAYLES
jgi:predicted RNA binding protein YcfA (HicA-like mRNA interferase family)